VTLYNVHLLSPRIGIVSVRHLHVSPIKQNTADRLYEVKRLTDSLRQEEGPLILTGDLNAPVQSLVCRQLFDLGLRDAFSEAGQGYGYTYGQYTRLGYPYVRIDHIMVNAPWQVQACWIGNSTGSDHIPVIADLFLPASP
jgi:endonuclease/exonuclease/phosphatase (EEP) superfamily protein YafD